MSEIGENVETTVVTMLGTAAAEMEVVGAGMPGRWLRFHLEFPDIAPAGYADFFPKSREPDSPITFTFVVAIDERFRPQPVKGAAGITICESNQENFHDHTESD